MPATSIDQEEGESRLRKHLVGALPAAAVVVATVAGAAEAQRPKPLTMATLLDVNGTMAKGRGEIAKLYHPPAGEKRETC